jgi:hypothetical protein
MTLDLVSQLIRVNPIFAGRIPTCIDASSVHVRFAPRHGADPHRAGRCRPVLGLAAIEE